MKYLKLFEDVKLDKMIDDFTRHYNYKRKDFKSVNFSTIDTFQNIQLL